jgi:hypothetical protein
MSPQFEKPLIKRTVYRSATAIDQVLMPWITGEMNARNGRIQ